VPNFHSVVAPRSDENRIFAREPGNGFGACVSSRSIHVSGLFAAKAGFGVCSDEAEAGVRTRGAGRLKALPESKRTLSFLYLWGLAAEQLNARMHSGVVRHRCFTCSSGDGVSMQNQRRAASTKS
jgi:hypothetical protein